MPPDLAESWQGSPNEQLNTNGKRANDEYHEKQPAKRLAKDNRSLTGQSTDPLPNVSIEQDDASSANRSESDDSVDNATEQASDQPHNDNRTLTGQSIKPLPIVSIEQDDASSANESESDDSVDNATEQTSDQPHEDDRALTRQSINPLVVVSIKEDDESSSSQSESDDSVDNAAKQAVNQPHNDILTLTWQSVKPPPVVLIENDDALSFSEGQSESEDSVHRTIEQATDQPQTCYTDYMSQSFPQVNFTPEMLRRTWFHIAVAKNPAGHSYQMNLKEAIDATTFSNGVRRRLELLGCDIGSGIMVADLHWIPTRSCLTEYSDHDALMWQIWDWPGWKSEGEMPFLNIYLVLEDKLTEVEV